MASVVNKKKNAVTNNPLFNNKSKSKKIKKQKSNNDNTKSKAKVRKWKGKPLSHSGNYEPLNISTIIAFKLSVVKKQPVKKIASETKQMLEKKLQAYFDKFYDYSVKNIKDFDKERDNESITSWFEVKQDVYTDEPTKKFSIMIHLFHFEFLQTQETTKFIFTLLQSKTINAKPEEYTIYPVKDENYNKKNKVFNKNLTKKIITKGKPFKTFVRYETFVKPLFLKKRRREEGEEEEISSHFLDRFDNVDIHWLEVNDPNPKNNGATWLYNIDIHQPEVIDGKPKIPKKPEDWEQKQIKINMVPFHFEADSYRHIERYKLWRMYNEKYEQEGKANAHLEDRVTSKTGIPKYMSSFKNNQWNEDRNKVLGLERNAHNAGVKAIHHRRIENQKDERNHDNGNGKILYEQQIETFKTKLPQHKFATYDGNGESINRVPEWLEEGLMSMDCDEVAIFQYEMKGNTSVVSASKDGDNNATAEYVLVKMHGMEDEVEEKGSCCITSSGYELSENGSLQNYLRCRIMNCKKDFKCVGCTKCLKCLCKCCMYTSIAIGAMVAFVCDSLMNS